MKQGRDKDKDTLSQNQSTQHYQSNTSMVSLEQKLELILQRHLHSPDTPSCTCHEIRDVRQQMISDFKQELCLAYEQFVEQMADSQDRHAQTQTHWAQEMHRVEHAYSTIQDMLEEHKNKLLHTIHIHQQNTNTWAMQQEHTLQEAIKQVTQIGQDIDTNLPDILGGMELGSLQDILGQYSQQIKEAGQVEPPLGHDHQLESLYQQLDGLGNQVRVMLQQPFFSLA